LPNDVDILPAALPVCLLSVKFTGDSGVLRLRCSQSSTGTTGISRKQDRAIIIPGSYYQTY